MAIVIEAPATGRAPKPTTERERRRGQNWPIRSVGGIVGFALIALIVVAAVVGPWLSPVDPAKQNLIARLQPPVGFGGSWSHPFGTDELGRDLFARVLAGARLSLAIALSATLITAAIGVMLGLMAGLQGGRWDAVVVFMLDVVLAMPFVVVAIAVTASMGGGLRALMVTLIATGWVGYARIIRLQSRSLRGETYVEAARALGAGRSRVLFRHLLPNVAGTIIVLATQQIAAMMLFEAALSYLGWGLSGSQITWGGMVAGGQPSLIVAWWVATIPGLMLVITVVGFALAGDWLRDRIEHN
jgi:peptide/nickel transport system permease protein